MASVVVSVADQPLYALVSETAPVTIAEVIARMQAIDAMLPVTDGLKWFNQVYLSVTQQVDLNPPGGAWKSPVWLERLDVIFAGFYFSAVANFLSDGKVPSAWSALFEARYRTGVDRIQFALAGFNAHINHDLALALVATDLALNVVPAADGPEHADYQSVNALLDALTPPTLTLLAADTLGVLAQDTGKVGRMLSFWDIIKARDLAWDFAGHLRTLNAVSKGAALDAQDGLTGALGRALLAMV